MNKVLIAAAVTVETSHAAQQYLEALTKLKGDFDIMLVDYSLKPIYAEWLAKRQKFVRVKVIRKEFPLGTEQVEKRAACHEIIRQFCIEKGYLGLLLLEHDVIIPEDGLKRLLTSKKPVISGVSYDLHVVNGQIVRLPTLQVGYDEERQKFLKENMDTLKKNNSKLFEALEKSKWDFSSVKRPLLNDEVEADKGIIKIKSANFDCLYIVKDVLEKVTFTSENGSKSDDALFFLQLQKLKTSAFADTAVQCGKKVKKSLIDTVTKSLQKKSIPASAA